MHPNVGHKYNCPVDNNPLVNNVKLVHTSSVHRDLQASNEMSMNQFLPSGPVQVPNPMSVPTQFIEPVYQTAFLGLNQQKLPMPNLGLTSQQLPMTFPGYSLSPCPSPCPSPAPTPFGMNMNHSPTLNPTIPNIQFPQIPNQHFVSPSPTPGYSYVDMYGNTFVPVIVGNYSPPPMLVSPPKQLAPQMVMTQPFQNSSLPFPSCSPTNSFTQSVSPDVFRDIDNVCTRSRPTSLDDHAIHPMPRSRRNSLNSNLVTENKKELVPRVLRELQMAFTNRFTTTGLRGTDVFRVKCKTKPSLKNILSLLQTLDTHVPLIEVSCPASTKKGKRQKRGFLCYVKVDESLMPVIKHMFDEFNESRGLPFNSIEINPQRKQPITIRPQ